MVPMNVVPQRVWVFALLAFAAGTLPLFAAPMSPHEHLSLDANWKFHLGDDWPNALYLNKAGVNKGPAGVNFDDAAWRTVNLPHDWAVELPFDPAADVGHGFKPVGPGFPATSVGWYRRTLDLPETDSGKRIWLQFDGAFRDTTVYVNGWFVGHYESGYYPFRADITDLVRFGKKTRLPRAWTRAGSRVGSTRARASTGTSGSIKPSRWRSRPTAFSFTASSPRTCPEARRNCTRKPVEQRARPAGGGEHRSQLSSIRTGRRSAK